MSTEYPLLTALNLSDSVMAAAPSWQRDVTADGGLGGAAQAEALSVPTRNFQDIDQLSKTYGHVADVSKDFRRDAELHDLLASTSKEDTYQQHFSGWPSLLRPLSPAVLELPTMVQEKYRNCQACCFCGLFPQIRRAWASVDDSLFLWRYDKSSDVPLEYSGEAQAITCVGLVTPKPGVFLPAIRYVLVICTTVEIVLLGVCPSRRGADGSSGGADGESIPEDILLQPLPLYSIPTDNVVITCCASGPSGRIFLGGADGNVYELSYHAADTWRHKRIYTTRLMSGLRQYLPTFVPSLMGLGAPPSVERLAVDPERHILYALNAASGIQVFDLGTYGTDPAKRVAEVSNVYAAAAAATGGRELFRGATADRKGAAVKYIVPIATSESAKLHLMAVTADGRRIYFTTHHRTPYTPYGNTYGGSNGAGIGGTAGGIPAEAPAAGGGGSAGGAGGEPPFPRRPETLLAVFVRAALPHAGISRGPTADLSRSAALEIVAAHYWAGCLLLSESASSAGGGAGNAGQNGTAGGGGTTKLLAASRNTTVPPATLNTHTGSGYGSGYGYGGYVVGGLRESVIELDNIVPGETFEVKASPCRPVLGPDALSARAGPSGDELTAAVWWPPPRFVLISTAGVIELEKRRPVELLMHILERNSQEQLRSFFQAYGAVEAAAMCYLIATSGPALTSGFRASGGLGPAAAPSSCSLGGGGVSALAARSAAAALENPLLVGEARMPEDAAAAEGGYPPAGAPSVLNLGGSGNGMYMGRAVDPNPGPSWSAGHRGLCLYVSRLLAPVYDKRVAAPPGGGAGKGSGGARVLTCRFSSQTLEALEDRLRGLAAFLETVITRRQQKGYATRASASASASYVGGSNVAGPGMNGLPTGPFGGGPYGGGAAVGGGGMYGFGAGAAGGAAEDPITVIHKRRRLEHAAQQEDEMAQRIRALVLRVAEACSLLRLLSSHNLGRLALRQLGSGTVDINKLANLTLRALVQEADGESMAAKLISGLVNEQLEMGMAGTGAASGAGSRLVAASGVGTAAGGAAGAEAVAATLQAAAPSYFRQEDRTYYQASALLKAAEAAAPGPEREATVKQAVSMLLSVPLVVHLESLTSQLANLKYYEGIVTVPLAAAAARDPEGFAARPELGPACELARQRRREAYGHVLGALRALILVEGGGPGAAGGAGTGGAAAMSLAERTAFKSALLKAALASTDAFFLDELYGFLISCGAADELLSRDAPGLEAYLAREGGLLPATPGMMPAAMGGASTAAAAASALSGGSPVGPLTAAQVALLELLCRMMVGKGRFLDAALVYGALGCRRAGPGPELGVPLRARVAALQSAVLHARSAGDATLVSRLDSDAKVVGLQAAMAERLQARRAALAATAGPHGSAAAAVGADGSGGADAAATLVEVDRALSELSGAPLELSVLYNAYAQPYGMWDICLQMIRFAGGGGGGGATDPAAVVRTLWDHELLRAYDQRREAGPAARLADACDAVSNLGPSLHPDDLTLPLLHVAWRLESIAAGLWPAVGGMAGDAASGVAATERSSDVIVPALTSAAGGSSVAVRRVYEALLTRGRGPGGLVVGAGGSAAEAQLANARVRAQLLRSAAVACAAALSDLQSGGGPATVAAALLAAGPAPGVGRAREAGALADAADRFALEARRIGGVECEEVARRLDAVRVQAEALR